jgi:hypothetical protein|tara:strand:+ start:230 stop:511 length:282 start_codon:yes stop_codon:yes gene_type:complete
LDAYEEGVLSKNLKRLNELQADLDERTDESGHGITMVLPYSALVSNGAAVDHMCRAITENCKGGGVNITFIPDLAETMEGKAAGYAVSINLKV